MPRRETPLDPEEGPLQRFAHELRQLRRAAGNPSYRDLAQRAHYSPSALSTAANGRDMPSRNVVLAFVAACGGDREAWERRWAELVRQLPDAAPAPAPAAAPPSVPEARPWWRRRWALLGGVVAVVVAAAVVAGVLWVLPNRAAARTFEAVAGIDCPHDAGRGVTYNQPGPGGASGWTTQVGGDWSGDGCRGNFAYTVGSGQPKPGHDYFIWWFRPSIPMPAACAIRVHMPRGDSTIVGGRPAYYAVLSGPNDVPVGAFSLNQTGHRGEWVDAGTYQVSGGQVAVRLNDRGRAGVNVAAGAVGVTCRSGGPAPSPISTVVPPTGTASPAAAGRPGASFEDGDPAGWTVLWGDATLAVERGTAYRGTHALVMSVSGARYSAIGTPVGLGAVHAGTRVTFHVWSSGHAGGVRTFAQDDRGTPHFAQPVEHPLPDTAGWTTLTWRVPVDNPETLGLQLTDPDQTPMTIRLDALSWP